MNTFLVKMIFIGKIKIRKRANMNLLTFCLVGWMSILAIGISVAIVVEAIKRK